MSSMIKYELWYSDNECSYTLCIAGQAANCFFESDAELQRTFEALSFEDAMCQMHEFLGWEPYKPLVDGTEVV